MTVASLNKPKSQSTRMVPAVPTDTSTILSNLLSLSDEARRERDECPASNIIPRDALMLLLRVMNLRDPAIIAHGQRIGTIAGSVAALLGWEQRERRVVEIAALLHDLGKIGVPEHILRKPGKLSTEEHDVVAHHHQAAVSLMQALQADASLISILTRLDQNFDAAGVEKVELNGADELPLGSRILAVADAYDSLSSPKAYRRRMDHSEVMTILRNHSGTRYDGNVVNTLERWYEAEGHALFADSEPFAEHTAPEMSPEQRDEVVVVTQILHVLYQFQTLYNGYFIVDAQQTYCIWSEGMRAMVSRGCADLSGQRWTKSDVQLSAISASELDDDDQNVADIIPKVLRSGQSLFGSHICRISDSRKTAVDVQTFPLRRSDGPVTGAVQLFRSKRGVERRSREYAELKLAATRDALTGAANRGQLETQLRHLIEEFHNQEGANPLSVIFLDVDHFKGVNDTYGHKAGDQVLVDLTRLLQNDTFSGEIIGRYGGEEFVVVCPDADLESAFRRAERLRLAIAKSSIGGIARLSVTSSFGVATTQLGDTVQTLFERADMCLLRAKEAGRNRTCREDDGDKSETNANSDQPESGNLKVVDGVMQYSENIEVSTSLELTALKLSAFLDKSSMKITKQEQGFMCVQAGRSGFSKRWGEAPERQPVNIEIQFETRRRVDTKARARRTIHFVAVKFQPVGRPADAGMFESRCAALTQELRGYLLSSYGDVKL